MLEFRFLTSIALKRKTNITTRLSVADYHYLEPFGVVKGHLAYFGGSQKNAYNS